MLISVSLREVQGYEQRAEYAQPSRRAAAGVVAQLSNLEARHLRRLG
jgi:hypothetical protein